MANFTLTAQDASGLIGFWDAVYGSVSQNPVYLNAFLNRLAYFSTGVGELIFDGPSNVVPPGGVVSLKINGVSQTITPIVVENNYAEYDIQHPFGVSPFAHGQTYNIEMMFAGESPASNPTQGIKDLYGFTELSLSGASDTFDDGVSGQIITSDFFKPVTVLSVIYLGPSGRSIRYKGIRQDASLYLGTRNLF